ncbi:methyltransferase family protein [Modestobacter lacusdianchii]
MLLLLLAERDVMNVAALSLYVGGLVVVFGLRSWIHARRTGDSGFRGISGAPGSLQWWAGVLFVVALTLGLMAPTLAVMDLSRTPDGPLADALGVTGLVIALIGFAGVLAAQSGMGASWRIGVDETELTGLVTAGAFAVARNPVFTAMLAAQTGVTLMVPTPVSIAALLCLLAAVELQVRLIEEPHLAHAHGADYHRYAARVGRFLPGIGRRPLVHQSTGAKP